MNIHTIVDGDRVEVCDLHFCRRCEGQRPGRWNVRGTVWTCLACGEAHAWDELVA